MSTHRTEATERVVYSMRGGRYHLPRDQRRTLCGTRIGGVWSECRGEADCAHCLGIRAKAEKAIATVGTEKA